MEKEKPQGSSNIEDSEIHAGRDFQQAQVIYNQTYIQGETVSIPRELTLHIPNDAGHIIGRDTELGIINQHLKNGKPTVLVNGIGGIGKTSVAAKYLVTNSSAYEHLAWLTVQSNLPETFYNNTVLLEALRLTEKVEKLLGQQRTRDAFELMLFHLNKLKSTLIVLDNANNLVDLVEYKNLFDTAKCHFIVTSRGCPEAWAKVDIDELPKGDAVALFKKLVPAAVYEGVSDEAIEQLLERLFYHTLLIELIGKTIARAGLSFEKVQQMVETKFIHDEKLNQIKVDAGSHGYSQDNNPKRAKVEEYIWVIFSEVKDLGDNAKLILRAMALLPVATPYDIDTLTTHLEFFEAVDIFEELYNLAERGWIEQEQMPGQTPQFKMHPLIADVVVKHLEVGVDFAAGYIGYIADLIYYNRANPNHNLFEINKNRPLADRLSDLFFEEDTSEIAELLHGLNWLNKQFGWFDQSTKHGERALSIALNLKGDYPTLVPKNQSSLAIVYLDLGLYEKAVKLFEAALESALKNFGDDHPDVAAFQSNLANVYKKIGRYEKSIELFKAALESDLNNFGKDHPTVAIGQSNLALVYEELGQHEKAATLLETALESDIKNFGKDNPTLAVRQSNLAIVYRSLGRYKEATELLEMAMESDIKNFGQDHPNIAIRRSILALVYIDLGQYEKSTELLEIAMESDLKTFGNDHPDIAIRQNNLAHAYYYSGRKEEAKKLWQAAYQNYLKNLGPDHPHTILFKKWAES